MMLNHLKLVFGIAVVMLFACFFMGISAAAEAVQVPGEITWVDTKAGKLQLKSDVPSDTGEITEYRITENETRVTNTSDQKFLSIADLRPGQHVIVDVMDGQEEKIVQKITFDPKPSSDLQEAYGVVESIDAAGTLALVAEKPSDMAQDKRDVNFTFEPANVIVMQSPSKEPVQLQVKPGDVIKVEFVSKDGKQLARSITLYAPKATSVTTTTTVVTTQ